jgi:hypothetical protein
MNNNVMQVNGVDNSLILSFNYIYGVDGGASNSLFLFMISFC